MREEEFFALRRARRSTELFPMPWIEVAFIALDLGNGDMMKCSFAVRDTALDAPCTSHRLYCVTMGKSESLDKLKYNVERGYRQVFGVARGKQLVVPVFGRGRFIVNTKQGRRRL